MSQDLLFIASGGRTGTTLLGDGLQDVIADCHSEHEPDVFVGDPRVTLPRIARFGLWHMVFGRMFGTSGLRALGHRLMDGTLSEDEAINLLRAQRAGYHASISEPLLAESNHRFWMVAPILHRAFPGSRTVGIVRDPRDWIESWRRYQPARHTPHFIRWWPLGPLTPAAVGDRQWAPEWEEMGPFGRLAWDWHCIMGRLEEAARLSHATKIFNFEAIVGEDDTVRHELFAFASFDGKYAARNGKGFTATKANASKGNKLGWREWPLEDVLTVERICGEQMRRFGYGQEPEWLDLVERAQRRVAA